MNNLENTIESLLSFTNGKKYNTIYADPPWQFQNRTGKVAPEHKRLARYETMSLQDIKALPVSDIADEKAHLYLWVPNALLPEGLAVMDAWGFDYKGNIVWEKIRKDGFPDGTARSQVNLIRTQKREHSRKPDEIIPIIEACSLPARIELFARGERENWDMWGDQATADYEPSWNTYKNHTRATNKKSIDQIAL